MSVDDATEWLSVVEWHALKAFVRQSRHQTKYVNALNGTTQAAIDRALSDVLGIADTPEQAMPADLDRHPQRLAEVLDNPTGNRTRHRCRAR